MSIGNYKNVAVLVAGLCLPIQAVAALPLPGDYNEDGVVDAQDYGEWQAGFGTEFSVADYPVWRDNLGAASGNQHTIPEPATVVLAGLGLLSLAGNARRWK